MYMYWPVSWWPPDHVLPNGKVAATCDFERWPRQEKTWTVEVIYQDPDKPFAVPNIPDNEGERHTLGKLTVANPRYEPEPAGRK